MGMAGRGNTALPAPRSRGVRRGAQAQVLQQLSRGIDAREVPAWRLGQHRDGALDAPQGLAGSDHWTKAPGVPPVVEGLVAPLEALGELGHRSDVCVKDDVRRRGGPTTSARQRRWAGLQVARPV
jgi:hypothetical protein